MKHLIADHDGIAGIDALQDGSSPRKLKIRLSAGRLETNEPSASKYETPATTPMVDNTGLSN